MSVLETGAGGSLAAELRDEMKLQLVLILSDQSSEMLSLSGSRSCDYRLILDAEHLSIQSGSIDTIVASLGDPYNTRAFWCQCARVLRPGGRVFFTTPAFAWANSFRHETGSPMMAAEFDLAEGGTVFVPSVVLTPSAQAELIESAGLKVEQAIHIDASEIRHTKPSPKLRWCDMVSGYRAVLPSAPRSVGI
jgi:SAM-dependent methyltransferase